MGGVWLVGAAQRGQHPPAGLAVAARTSQSTILGLPGAKRRGRAFSWGEAELGGAHGCSWCLPASRYSPGGGQVGRCTPQGLPAEREVRAGRALGWYGGMARPRPQLTFSPRAPFSPCEEESQGCVLAGGTQPPTCAPHRRPGEHQGMVAQHQAACAHRHGPSATSSTYRLPAGPRHPREPPLPFGALRGRGG